MKTGPNSSTVQPSPHKTRKLIVVHIKTCHCPVSGNISSKKTILGLIKDDSNKDSSVGTYKLTLNLILEGGGSDNFYKLLLFVFKNTGV
jgi:hypothetical protein